MKLDLQRFASIAELFSQVDVLDYVRDRKFATFVGDSLFQPRRVQTLKLDQVYAGNRIPVIAQVAAFDSEAEIGSRMADKKALELALIKKKLPISEEDLIALQNPRTAAEAKYLKDRVYNDIDNLVQAVLARVEKMSMDALATGKVTVVDQDTKQAAEFDYQVPAEHQADLTAKGSVTWDDDSSDPIKDITDWSDKMDVTATRVLTSKKIFRILTRNPNVLKAVFGTSTKALGQADFDAFMQAQGLPIIRTYDDKYSEKVDGKLTNFRYFPEDAFTMMPDDQPGEKLFGPTPEEVGLAGDPSVQTSAIGNVFATIYRETKDPVGTWEKATAVALPSFPGADEVFQAKPIKLA
ncbi:major capsid protein E [Lactobacillus brevis] [Lactiplantibacillus mudanjiangensis]|uniref:major capsid protein n=1 Tax=Lactiplantibacillus mudanjiangensis TaxID=1296538 RepID=UPI0010151110|nr:major capsid protein E [Lactobacillus brevis] [Lactiplantibacillus mudanjiangensis]